MQPDHIMALFLGVGLTLSLVNTRALLVDGCAKGVRPYLAGWVAISNCVLGIQLLTLSQALTAWMFILCGLASGVNCLLIARHQWRKRQSN